MILSFLDHSFLDVFESQYLFCKQCLFVLECDLLAMTNSSSVTSSFSDFRSAFQHKLSLFFVLFLYLKSSLYYMKLTNVSWIHISHPMCIIQDEDHKQEYIWERRGAEEELNKYRFCKLVEFSRSETETL